MRRTKGLWLIGHFTDPTTTTSLNFSSEPNKHWKTAACFAPWPRTCSLPCACLHGVMLNVQQLVVRNREVLSDRALHTQFQHEALWGQQWPKSSPPRGPFEVVWYDVCTDVWVRSWEAKPLYPSGGPPYPTPTPTVLLWDGASFGSSPTMGDMTWSDRGAPLEPFEAESHFSCAVEQSNYP